MPLRLLVAVLFMLFAAGPLARAQRVTGTIRDAAGEPLPFATVTVAEDPSRGTTASLDGRYAIDLGGGGGTLEFRYVGYELARRRIAAGASAKTEDVVLAEAAYELAAPTVSASAEDPAYRVMREAAARREAYLTQEERYEVEVYVKGQVRVDEAPEKVMGQDVGDMGGLLDSSRAGIVYLSETFATLQVEPPDRIKETVTASTVSGDPRGYSFNTATSLDFDLYRRTSEFGKPILSPLVEGGEQHYRFRMMGARLAENGRLVYRIHVEARSTATPAWTGTVYIEDESFHLLDADLAITGAVLNAPGLDSLLLLQSYAERAGGRWEVVQRRVEPVLGLLGFRFRGVFAAVYREYDYAPIWPESPFGKISSEVLAEANQVDSSVFADRPIPLTDAEARDYVRKDSINRVRDTPAYRDSVEQRRNRFTVGSLLTGYTHSDWRRNERWSYDAPLTDIGFHPVTGLRLGVGGSYSRDRDEEGNGRWTAGGKLRYGFADERFYPTLRTSWRLNRLYDERLELSGGRELFDYHRHSPVDEAINAGYALSRKQSFLRLYESRFFRVDYATQLRPRGEDGRTTAPWATLTQTLIVERRLPRVNSSDYSFRKRERTFPPNAPLIVPTGVADFVRPSTLLRYDGGLSFDVGARYSLRPDALMVTRPARVVLGVDWRFGQEVGDPEGFERTSFLFVSLSAKRADWRLGRFGAFGYRAEVGAAAWANDGLGAIDRQQFAGSEILVNGYTDYLRRFLGLPHYGLVTQDPWASAVVEHDFDGWIWQRLPLLKKLGWSVVVRGAGIIVPAQETFHSEVGVALDNIGFGPARFLRADVVWARADYRPDGGYAGFWRKPMYRIGINVPLGLEP